jgi:glutathione synthase/RimK-type ligase-like ATP-grasp enzyme
LNRIVEGVPIRSRQYGWKLNYYSQTNYPNALPQGLDLLARWAMAALGWDFGAVDVIKTHEGKYVLIEANSAPSLRDEATCAAYTAAIKEHLDA